MSASRTAGMHETCLPHGPNGTQYQLEGQEISETGEELHDFLLSDELRWGRRKMLGKLHHPIFSQHLQQISVLRTDKIAQELLPLRINTFRHVSWLQC